MNRLVQVNLDGACSSQARDTDGPDPSVILPKEMFHKIIRNIYTQSDLELIKSYRTINKGWNGQITDFLSTVKTFSLENKKMTFPQGPNSFDNVYRMLPNVREINLTNCEISEDFFITLSKFNKVETLRLKSIGNKNFKWGDVPRLTLKRLELDRCKISELNMALLVNHSRKLSELSITRPMILFFGIVFVNEPIPIKSLTLEIYNQFDVNSTLKNISENFGKKLEYFSFKLLRVKDNSIENFNLKGFSEAMSALKRFEFGFHTDEQFDIFSIKYMVGLEEITLIEESHDHLTSSLNRFNLDQIFGELINVKSISIIGVNMSANRLTIETLKVIAQNCKKLDTLYISGANEIKPNSVSGFFSMKSLRNLKLKEMFCIDNYFVYNIWRNLPKLEVLEIISCPRITQNIVESILNLSQNDQFVKTLRIESLVITDIDQIIVHQNLKLELVNAIYL